MYHSDQFERLRAALASRYRIVREAGRGGMATVYLAEDLRHERQVAVKVLRPELAAALGPERFLREIQIAATLAHPHILPLHDSGEAGGFLYYVMPFVEGETLRDLLERQKQLPTAEAVEILREVADGLAYAHSRGIVHRDIKPENIMFMGGHAVVTDFGVATAVGVAAGSRLTETGLAVRLDNAMAFPNPFDEDYLRTLNPGSDIATVFSFDLVSATPARVCKFISARHTRARVNARKRRRFSNS